MWPSHDPSFASCIDPSAGAARHRPTPCPGEETSLALSPQSLCALRRRPWVKFVLLLQSPILRSRAPALALQVAALDSQRSTLCGSNSARLRSAQDRRSLATRSCPKVLFLDIMGAFLMACCSTALLAWETWDVVGASGHHDCSGLLRDSGGLPAIAWPRPISAYHQSLSARRSTFSCLGLSSRTPC